MAEIESSTPASATDASVSPVDGFTTRIRACVCAARHVPPINKSVARGGEAGRANELAEMTDEAAVFEDCMASGSSEGGAVAAVRGTGDGLHRRKIERARIVLHEARDAQSALRGPVLPVRRQAEI